MSDSAVIKINAITVPPEAGDELAQRFAARAGAVDGDPGFLGFELLKPTDDRTQWLVVTRWADQASFDDWVASASFAQGHEGAAKPASHGDGEGAPAGPGRGPVSTHSELWSYVVAGGSTPG